LFQREPYRELAVFLRMYCPSCGSEDKQLSQFCRTCGTDLRFARPSNDRVDALTASAITAREQIGLAIAEKIRQVESSRDMRRLAQHVLPAFEKFLRSPEEKRLRRIRAGVLTTGIGLAASIGSLLGSFAEEDFVGMLIPSFITFMVGLAVLVNGLLFTVRKQKSSAAEIEEKLPTGLRGLTPPVYQQPLVNARTNDLAIPSPMPSVTDHTTHHLKQKS
jgi:hypothetical protein